MDCYLTDARVLIHVFEIEGKDQPTPRDRRCDCGAVTWGEMDDLWTLTEMWAITP